MDKYPGEVNLSLYKSERLLEFQGNEEVEICKSVVTQGISCGKLRYKEVIRRHHGPEKLDIVHSGSPR